MKKIKKGIKIVLGHLGFNVKILKSNLTGIGWYISDRNKFKKQLKSNPNDSWNLKFFPILFDKYDQSGNAHGQYFYQDLFVANQIFQNNPQRHIDIGSRIDGFVAHVASFRKIDVFDIRPLSNHLQNINFIQADLMNPQESMYNSTDSLSCLHTIEHFGLGRYSDPIDVNGHIKGLENMYKILKKDGVFYFSTPIGPKRVEFNAHRVFSIQYLLDLFQEKYEIMSFSYIDDKNNFFTNVSLDAENVKNNFGCKTGCGVFILKKL